MSRWNNPNCGFKKEHKDFVSPESRKRAGKKVSQSLLGHFVSEETREKTRQKLKGNQNMLGHKQTKETKKKMGDAKKGKRNPQWQDGKSFELYSFDWTDTLRESIRQRDDYVCQMCGIHQDELDGWYKQLDVHHIDYDKDNCNPENLITLCRKCHAKTNYNREYWSNYFNYHYDKSNNFKN